MRPGDRCVRSRAFVLFACALRVVLFIRVRSFHSRAPIGSRVLSYSFGPFLSCSLEYVRDILVHTRDRRVHSRARSGAIRSSGSFGCVRFIPVAHGVAGFVPVRFVHSPGGRRVRSGAFGPFLSTRDVNGFVRVHSRAPCWW